MKKCAEQGMKSIAVSDHGILGGIWECAKWASKYNINLLPGCEFYLVPDTVKCRGKEWSSKGKSSHIILLASSYEGWNNILVLTALANFEGYYAEPRIDYAMLKKHSAGVWCTTSCLSGPASKALKAGKNPRIVVDHLYSIFGERLSLEVQVNTIPEQVVLNEALVQIHQDTNIPLVCTTDAHYLDAKDSEKQDLLFAMQLGKDFDDPNRHRLPPHQHSVETPDEVWKRFRGEFSEELVTKMFARTAEIGENSKFNINYQSKDYKIPTLDVAAQPDFQEFLKWRSGCECHTVEGICLVHSHACDENCKH
jgi:DNA polymerase-3 subunit alpha